MDGQFKPCPFCGCDKIKLSSRIVVKDNDIKTVYRVHCTNCKAAIDEYDTNYQAIAAWNMRSYENTKQ